MSNRDLARLVACHSTLHSAMAGTRMAAPLHALTLDYDKALVGMLIAFFALPQSSSRCPRGSWPIARVCGGLSSPV